jgi:hypothetical protein
MLQEKPLALKREHPALQKMKFMNFFLYLWVIFALLYPDPQHCMWVILSNFVICSFFEVLS